MAQMLFTPGAAAVGIAASAADGDEAGGQDGAFGLEFFLAGLEGATDEGGVFGRFLRLQGRSFRPDNCGITAISNKGKRPRQPFLRMVTSLSGISQDAPLRESVDRVRNACCYGWKLNPAPPLAKRRSLGLDTEQRRPRRCEIQLCHVHVSRSVAGIPATAGRDSFPLAGMFWRSFPQCAVVARKRASIQLKALALTPPVEPLV
jgi:hypothetical protein